MERYLRNKKLISQDEQEKIWNSKVVVLGCGGLGGYIIEMLSRLGIGKLKIVDYDSFDKSNLNRQIVSTEKNLGLFKVVETEKRIKLINSQIEVEAVNEKISEKNIDSIIKDYDIVVDALDSSVVKKIVEKSCKRNDIPMVHGAIGGFVGQVSVIMPGDDLLDKVYGDKNLENPMGNPSFTPALVGSIQVGEVTKLLLEKEKTLKGKLLYIDLENMSFKTLESKVI